MRFPLNVRFECQIGDKCILCDVADLQRERERTVTSKCAMQLPLPYASRPVIIIKVWVYYARNFYHTQYCCITGWFLFFSMEITLDAMKSGGMHVSFYNNLDFCLKKSESLLTLSLCLYILRRSPLLDYVSGTNENKHIPYSSKQNSSLYLPRNTNIGYYLLWYYFLIFLLQSLFPELLNFSGCIFRWKRNSCLSLKSYIVA
jgi:hypothetical protein